MKYPPRSWEVSMQPPDQAVFMDLIQAHREAVRHALQDALAPFAVDTRMEAIVTKATPGTSWCEVELWCTTGVGPVKMPARAVLPMGPQGGHLQPGTLVELLQPVQDIEVGVPLEALQDIQADLRRGIQYNPGGA